MVMIYSISLYNFAISEIIPLKKPIQTKEETQKKLLIDVLKPLPKPIKKSEKKIVEEKVVVKKEKKNRPYFTKKKAINCRYREKNRSKNIKIL
jgi:soluble lytic murein transglycosylase